MQIYIWCGTLNQNICDGQLCLTSFSKNANIANFVHYEKTLLD